MRYSEVFIVTVFNVLMFIQWMDVEALCKWDSKNRQFGGSNISIKI